MTYFILGFTALFILALLLYFKKGRYFLISSLLGVLTLTAANLLSAFTHTAIGINLLTLGTAIVFGPLGVAVMIMLKGL